MRVFGRSSSMDRGGLVVALVVVSCAAAACGGGTKSGSSTASVGNSKEAVQYNHALKFAKCMRRHGVYFPDPGVQGSQMTIDLSNVNTNAPAYTRASKLCATPPGG